jgi:hypothetical protein
MVFFNLAYMTILSICFVVGIANYKYFTIELRLIFLLILITFFVEWLGFYNQHLIQKPISNAYLYTFYSPLEFILIGSYFYKLLQNPFQKKVIIVLFISVLVFFYFDLFDEYKGDNANYQFYLLPNLYFSLFSIFYFRKLLMFDIEFSLRTNPNFWIVTGMLFFYSGFFFLSGFINFIAKQDKDLAQKLFTINHILNIIYYSLITYGFICQRNLAKSSL